MFSSAAGFFQHRVLCFNMLMWVAISSLLASLYSSPFYEYTVINDIVYP